MTKRTFIMTKKTWTRAIHSTKRYPLICNLCNKEVVPGQEIVSKDGSYRHLACIERTAVDYMEATA